VFGAFVVGVAMPRPESGERVAELQRGLGWAVGLLVPIYFVSAGMAIDIPGLRARDLAALIVIVVAACAGKFLGAYGGARAARIKPREAAAIGVLMNTRGLVEIVMLSVGRDQDLIDDRTFTLFALMAIVTTLLTMPLLRAIGRPSLEPLEGRTVAAS
jgi:Kef-type K+ transport system membrane component KefB